MDKETGLYNFPQRYYDSRNVKWLTLDPIGPMLMAKKAGSVTSLNWYNYCSNNPVMYHDPEGLQDITAAANGGPVAVAAVGLVATVIGLHYFDAWLTGKVNEAIWGPDSCTPSEVFYGIKDESQLQPSRLESARADSLAKAQSKAEAKTKSKREKYVYHATNSKPFIALLFQKGERIIKPGSEDNRFGAGFYVAENPFTAILESANPIVAKFSIKPGSYILDLTDPNLAAEFGYTMGLSHDEVKDLILPQLTPGIQGIRFPSEKDKPGGMNYVIFDPSILEFKGIWQGEL